ncbi:MAG: SocA family protein [Bacteroides sp.]|nr:SocA family protein [Bacteroides sp.]
MNDIQLIFNREKSLHAILYIAQNLKRRDFHKIFKILYFSDREYLSLYGQTITGDCYIAMEAGPVPTKIYDMFKIVRGDSYMTDDELSTYFEVSNWMYIVPKCAADLRKLSPNEIKVIDRCVQLYGSLSYDEIKEKSHDIAWRSTARDYPISVENIAREAGLQEDELSYIQETMHLSQIHN